MTWLRWTDILISVGILLLFLLFRKLFEAYLFSFLLKRISRPEGAVNWVQAFEKPVRAFIVLIGAYLAVAYVAAPYPGFMFVAERICRSIGIILAGWGIYNLSASTSVLLEEIGKRFGVDETSMLIPFLSKVLRFFIVAVILTAVGSEWGFTPIRS